jgi:4-alpha-glucanotransferase
LNDKLKELARLYGIETSYVDMSNIHREADPEALLLVLRMMGAELKGFDDVAHALERRHAELRERAVEPVMVAWDGELHGRRFAFGYHAIEMQGREVFVISAPRKAHFPGDLTAADCADNADISGGATALTRPFRAPSPGGRGAVSASNRLWGIFAPIYALHSERNPAAGDLTDFENLMDWMYSLGGTVAGTLPLLGAFLDEPFEPSPYSPATRLFWNEFYVDLERIPEFAGHIKPKPARITEHVDYHGVMAAKRRILEDLSNAFFSDGTPERLQAFAQFIRNHPGVEDYARFRAVMDRLRQPWTNWPSRLRNGVLEEEDYDHTTKNYHLYAQWVVQEQLESLSKRGEARGQLLYLDLPLGLNSSSYDTWRHRDLFVDGAKGGAPPDPVFTKGQNWGFPPMTPEAMRLSRYDYIIAYLRNHFRYAKLLRIDHVMGLYRLYWIPDGFTGDKGVYVRYPAEELWAILSLESHRYQAGIVGENLGTVPPEVNAAMAAHDIREMYVVQYEVMGTPDAPSLRPPLEESVASLNTHDMPPFAAFLNGDDIDDRLDLGFLDEKAANEERKQRKTMRRIFEDLAARPAVKPAVSAEVYGALKFLSDSNANVVLVNLEDLWQETLPQNIPATSSERPNWRRRVRPSLEQIRKMAGIAEVLSHVFADRSRSLPV